MKGTREITFEAHSVGTFLSEVTRAALHAGNPSAVLRRVVAGLAAYEREAPSVEVGFLADLRADLEATLTLWEAKEGESIGQDIDRARERILVSR